MFLLAEFKNFRSLPFHKLGGRHSYGAVPTEVDVLSRSEKASSVLKVFPKPLDRIPIANSTKGNAVQPVVNLEPRPATMSPKDCIAALEAECAKLRSENESLKAIIQGRASRSAVVAPPGMPRPDSADVSVRHDSPTSEKIALFRSLYRGREDTYPLRWKSKTGRPGYSPACANEWPGRVLTDQSARCIPPSTYMRWPVR